MSPLFKPFKDRDEDYVALVLKHGRFAGRHLPPSPIVKRLYHGELRRVCG